MSAPFAPSPKLREYLDWALSEGCTVQDAIGGRNGNTGVIRIEARSGRVSLLAGVHRDETLPHSKVANLDRQLGLASPFPKTPSGF